jgi:hypothetical protein
MSSIQEAIRERYLADQALKVQLILAAAGFPEEITVTVEYKLDRPVFFSEDGEVITRVRVSRTEFPTREPGSEDAEPFLEANGWRYRARQDGTPYKSGRGYWTSLPSELVEPLLAKASEPREEE